MPKKLTTEEFIQNAKKKHGNKYNYDRVKYLGSRATVEIVCPVHGVFKITPSKHISGRGCQECGYEIMRNHQRRTVEEFIKKAKLVHKDRYDYSDVNYTSSDTKVKILCKVEGHNHFWQTPANHLYGQGCKKCAKNRDLTKDIFIRESNLIHNNKYDYSKVEYKNSSENVVIICKKHGEFKQNVVNHKAGHGCKECAKEITSEKLSLPLQEFIDRAKEIHKDKYDYSLINKTKYDIHVNIVCSHHGVFSQRVGGHLEGKEGCSECLIKKGVFNITKAERHKDEWQSVEEYVYIIEFESKEERYIKVGIARDVKSRLKELKKDTRCKAIDKHFIKTNLYAAVMAEQTFLESNKHLSYTPLAKFHGHTECIITEEKSNTINQIQTLIKNYEQN